jgi:hypothetical protein
MWCYFRNNKGKLSYSGLGCVLMNSQIFRKLSRPWFRTDVNYALTAEGLGEPRPSASNSGYGKLDVHFYASLSAKGFKWDLAELECAHLRVNKYGPPHVNEGVHDIQAIA